jgi:hypothetical protein
MVRDLAHVVDREKAKIGVFMVLVQQLVETETGSLRQGLRA